MRHRFWVAVTILAASLAPLASQAQPAGAPTASTQGARIDASHLRAKQLMDRDVFTNDGTEIGEIEDLVIDLATGRILSVVVEVETRLGLTDKYISIEFNQLRFTPGERRVTINLTRDQVRSLPGITYNN